MTLSQEHIDKLFSFVESKYVRYKDVQFEIVDHLASGIEEMQSENPNLSFEAGLEEMYSRFPVTGFAGLVSEKEKSMKAYWQRRFFSYLKEYFTLPKIIFTFLLTYGIYTFYQYYPIGPNRVFCLVVVIPCMLYYLVMTKKNIELSEKQQNYLILSSYYHMSSLLMMFAIYPILFISVDYQSEVIVGLFSLYTALILIIIYATTMVFPKMLENEIDANYKHLKLI